MNECLTSNCINVWFFSSIIQKVSVYQVFNWPSILSRDVFCCLTLHNIHMLYRVSFQSMTLSLFQRLIWTLDGIQNVFQDRAVSDFVFFPRRLTSYLNIIYCKSYVFLRGDMCAYRTQNMRFALIKTVCGFWIEASKAAVGLTSCGRITRQKAPLPSKPSHQSSLNLQCVLGVLPNL